MTNRIVELTRRELFGGAALVAGAFVLGCSPSAKADRQAMAVYRDPNCGCCGAWAALAQKAGYETTLIDHADMPALKRQLGVPAELAACHTAVIGNYVVEGHVPLDDVKRLLEQRPVGIRGIAVPGMPLGSPGMEVPDGTREAFSVIAFYTSGRPSSF